MHQLPLDLALPPRLGRDDFLRADANAAVLDWLERWPAWPERTGLLIGPPGAGKSHLGAIWAADASATTLTRPDLERADWPDRLPAAVLLDDADRLGIPDATLFHLANLVRERRATLLMTASTVPDLWGVRTPDLLSRLRLIPAMALGAPDDALVRAVLVKLFADRQLAVDESVVAFLGLRLGRALGDARTVVDHLDRTALARNRRVTRPLAAAVLVSLSLDEDRA